MNNSFRMFKLAGLILASIILNIIEIPFDYIPPFLNIEFGLVPIIIILTLYDLRYTLIAIALQNVCHMAFATFKLGYLSYTKEFYYFIEELLLVLILRGILILIEEMRIRKEEHVSRKTMARDMLFAGTCSSVAVALIDLPLCYYLIFPMFQRYYDSLGLSFVPFNIYKYHLHSITYTIQGLFIFNLPFKFIMFMIAILVGTLVYYLKLMKVIK